MKILKTTSIILWLKQFKLKFQAQIAKKNISLTHNNVAT